MDPPTRVGPIALPLWRYDSFACPKHVGKQRCGAGIPMRGKVHLTGARINRQRLHANARLLLDLRRRFLNGWSRAQAEVTTRSRRCELLRHRPIEADLALFAHTGIAQRVRKKASRFRGHAKRRTGIFAGSCSLGSWQLHPRGDLGPAH